MCETDKLDETNSQNNDKVKLVVFNSCVQVVKHSTCDNCRLSLFDIEPFNSTLARLTCLKQRSGLKYPSRSVFRVVQLADQVIRMELVKTGGAPPSDALFSKHLQRDVYRASTADRHIFGELYREHSDLFERNHVPYLIKAIAQKYCNARIGAACKTFVVQKKGAASSSRNKATRTLIFQGI